MTRGFEPRQRRYIAPNITTPLMTSRGSYLYYIILYSLFERIISIRVYHGHRTTI